MLEYFGYVQNSEIELNDAGQIVKDRIKWLENNFDYLGKNPLLWKHDEYFIELENI